MSDHATGFDTVLDLCQEQQRRIVLSALVEEQRSLTMRDLTQTIVRHTHHTSLSETSEDVLTQIQISLHHRHLPKLEAAGIIEYDSERHLVELTNEFGWLQPTFAPIVDADPILNSPIKQ